MEPVIEIKGLSKRFRVYDQPMDRLKEWLTPMGMSFHWAYWALKDINLTVEKGEALGIIGVNGAGKSTLLKILCGTLAPTFGTVETRGRIAGLLELGSGFHPEFTGRQNIYLNARLLGMSDQDIARKLQGIVDFAELGDFLDHPLRIYSTGMALRLGFSVAANVDPDILIIDEALAVGDAYFQQKCLKYLRTFRENGGTLLFVSHDPGAVKLLCDRAVLLHKGTIAANDTPENVLNYYNELIARPAADADAFALERKMQEARARKPQHSGTFEAVVSSVELSSDGRATRTVFTGRPLELAVTLTAFSDIPAPTIGFSLRDRLGYEIYGTNTALAKCATSPLKAGESLTVRFALPPVLGPGEYTVTAAAHDGRDHIEHCYDWSDRMLAFKVVAESEIKEQGLLSLPVTMSVEKAAGSAERARAVLESAFENAPAVLVPSPDENPCLTGGFYPAEKIGERTAAWMGQTGVAVLKGENVRKVVLECAPGSQLAEGPLEVALSVNGGQELAASLAKPGPQILEFALPETMSGVLRCTFRCGRTFVPSQGGASGDRRRLGLLIFKISLEQ